MSQHIMSNLELNMIKRMAEKLYNDNKNIVKNVVNQEDINEGLKNLLDVFDYSKESQYSENLKFMFCSCLDTLSYCFSLILSEVRQAKRNVITAIFEQNPKVAEEKKALEKKLDSFPEYAELRCQEEYLFQFIEHITNIKNNMTYLYVINNTES